MREGHPQFTPEHVLKALLDDGEGMAAGLIDRAGGQSRLAKQMVDAALAKLPKVSGSGVFMAMTFVVFALYGLFAAAMRDHVVTRPAVMTWLRRSFAAAFVALGAKLALTER